MSCQKERCFFTERCDKIIFVLLNPLQKNLGVHYQGGDSGEDSDLRIV